MSEPNKELYRAKNLERMKTPENLDEYIRVTNPGVWILLLSIVLLLAGACVWGVYGHIDSTVNADVQAADGTVVCFVGENELSLVDVGMIVKFGSYTGTISAIGENTGMYCVCEVSVDEPVRDGFYDGELVITRVKPMSLVFN